MTVLDMMLDAKLFINKELFSSEQVEKVLSAYRQKKSINTPLVVRSNADIYLYNYRMVAKREKGFIINISGRNVDKTYIIE